MNRHKGPAEYPTANDSSDPEGDERTTKRKEICECGHPKWMHSIGGRTGPRGRCAENVCVCTEYRRDPSPTDEPVSREGEPTWMDKGIGALDMNAEWALGWLTRQAGLVMRDDPSEAWRAGWCDADQLANSEGEETLKAMTSVPLPPKAHHPTHADARSEGEE